MLARESTVDFKGKAIKFLIVVLLLALGYNLSAGSYGFLGIISTKREIARLQQEEKRLVAELVDLEITLSRLQSDTLYLEGLARRNFQYGRRNETVIQF
jgi:cell division protein FtsB